MTFRRSSAANAKSDGLPERVRSRVAARKSGAERVAAAAPARKRAAGTVARFRPDPIVSSSHLAESAVPELSEFEFGLIVAEQAFDRWIVRCMAAAGLPGLAPLDVLVLHHVHHRARDKRLADIAFTLNVQDLHVVNYALKKLLAAGVVEAQKAGKEVLYRTNERGRAHIARYREVRERCLVAALAPQDGEVDSIRDTARVLRWLSGLYDQAARAATSL